MCLTSSDERIEINRNLKRLNKKKPFKIRVEIIFKDKKRIEKTVKTPDSFDKFVIKHGVYVPVTEIFDVFKMALFSHDERTAGTHYFMESL